MPPMSASGSSSTFARSRGSRTSPTPRPRPSSPRIAKATTANCSTRWRRRRAHGRDLLNAIEAGDFPRWTLSIQVMTDEQARTHKHNPFDLTKVWPKADYPLTEDGVMELNRYRENYFAEV